MRRPFPFVLLLGLSAVGATCQGRPSPDEVPPPKLNVESETPVKAPAISDLDGVDMTRVPGSYRADALRILNENFCYCGCPRTIASCLSNRESCSCVECSELVANFVVDEFARGRPTADVEDALVGLFSEAYNANPHEMDFSEQPSMGSESAPHTIVEFADYQCPHCRIAFGELMEFAKDRNDIRIIYYFFPLTHFGPKSVQAAAAADAARRQGRFWEMSALIYNDQKNISPEKLKGYAEQLNLDMKKFQADYEDEATIERILADRKFGQSLGITGTPAIFVDGRPLGIHRHDPKTMAMRIEMEKGRQTCQ